MRYIAQPYFNASLLNNSRVISCQINQISEISPAQIVDFANIFYEER